MEWNWKIIESIDNVDLDIFARRLFLEQVTPPISLYVHPEYYRKLEEKYHANPKNNSNSDQD